MIPVNVEYSNPDAELWEAVYFSGSEGFAYERRPVRVWSGIWRGKPPRFGDDSGKAAEFWSVPSPGSTSPVIVKPGEVPPVSGPGVHAIIREDAPMEFFCLDPEELDRAPGAALEAEHFGIEADTGAPQTGAINRALQEISRNGGGTLRLGPGIYEVTTIRLCDWTTLWLEQGAVLRADLDPDSYPLADPETVYRKLPPSLVPGAMRRVVEADHVTGASVRGRGVIDGRGSEIRRRTMASGRPLINLVYAVGCKDLVFEGVTLLDSEFWNTHLILCEDTRFSFVKIINEIPPRGWAANLGTGPAKWTWNNADGINPDSSQRVIVENCLLHTGDDCLPVKNTGTYKNILRDVRDITCRRCVMATPVTAMKIGTETRGDSIERILFENNLVVSCGRAIGIELKDGAIARDVVFRNIRVRECNRPFDFQILRRQDEPTQKVFSKLESAVVEHLVIDRHAVEGAWSTSQVHGLDSGHTVSGLHLSGCCLSDLPMEQCALAQLDINEHAEIKID